jgi:hypothetical protein
MVFSRMVIAKIQILMFWLLRLIVCYTYLVTNRIFTRMNQGTL